MKFNKIFPRNIYGTTFLGFEKEYLRILESSIELLRRGDKNGIRASNESFGWQSHFLPHTGPFEKLTTKIISIFNDSLKEFNLNKATIHGMWANINYKGDINWPHKHAGSLSGVYYISTYSNSGNLVLDNYDTQVDTIFEKIKGPPLGIKPHNDLLVLFDSSCIHHVEKNLSENPRISISFNIECDA